MATWSEAEWNTRRAQGLPAWEANKAQADTDYWKRIRENEFFAANPNLQLQATQSLQSNAMFNPRSLIPSSFQPQSQPGYRNADTTGPAYPGAPPPNPFPQPAGGMPAAPANAMITSQPLASSVSPMDTSSVAQPQPANAMMGPQLPAGFDIRAGSQDPAINAQVYGNNYFPGNLPGFEGIANKEQFFALTPDQQGSYREALYLANQRASGQGPQPGGVVPPLPGDPVGQPGYYPGKPPDPSTGYLPPGTPWPAGTTAPAPFDPTRPPSTPAAPGFREAPPAPPGGNPIGGNAMAGGGAYPGGRGNYMGYGPNGGGLRVDPNYLPETFDYKESPEYLWRLQQAERGLNRQLLSMGRSDSTGGINAMANLRSQIAGEEVDKQYQRGLTANMQNYQRMFGANQANYGRTVDEDQTGWNRATQLDNTGFARQNLLGEQDWNRNYQLASLGFDATRTGVNAGNQTGANLANLLSQNGANQASLALSQGSVSADQIERLMNSGWGFDEIERLFGNRSPAPGAPGPGAPALPPYSGAGVGNPGSLQNAYDTYGGGYDPYGQINFTG